MSVEKEIEETVLRMLRERRAEEALLRFCSPP